jgi:hypothetical protein
MYEKGMKNERFLDAKTFENYALCNEFMVLAISEKVRNPMPKWLPNFMKNEAKSIPGAPRVDLFMDFNDFVPCRKIVVFSMAFWAVQKSKKSSLGGAKARKVAPGLRRVGGCRVG